MMKAPLDSPEYAFQICSFVQKGRCIHSGMRRGLKGGGGDLEGTLDVAVFCGKEQLALGMVWSAI